MSEETQKPEPLVDFEGADVQYMIEGSAPTEAPPTTTEDEEA
jgi:hypothetical protein